MSTWQERLKVAIGPQGYEPCMRRSLQTVLLYEAKRCVTSKTMDPALKPFQRKAAYIDQMLALLESLTFVPHHLKEEVMYRTQSSKEILQMDVAWKRAKGIAAEMEHLAELMTPLITAGRTHSETVDLLVQSLYEKVTGFEGKKYPMHWEHAHNNVVLAFRLYYRYNQFDTSFPDPVSPREIYVPLTRDAVVQPISSSQKKDENEVSRMATGVLAPAPVVRATPRSLSTVMMKQPPPATTAPVISAEAQAADDRLKVLKEVREHLELLKEFEDIVPPQELAERKRALFLSLPSAPTEVKKLKNGNLP